MDEQKLDSKNDFQSDITNKDIKSITTSREQPSYIMDILAVIGVLIITMIISTLISGALTNSGSISKTFALFLSYTIPFSITIIFSIWLFMRRGYKNVLPKLSISAINAPFVLYGCILLILSGIVLEPVLSIFPEEWLIELNKQIGTGGWAIITTVAMAPILEEILFRGVIQGSAMSRYGAMRAIIISSAAFALIHIMPQQVIYAFVAGLILGYIYWKTQSILSVIIIHAFNNGTAFIQKSIFGDEISNQTIRELIKNDTLYWISYSIITILFITALIMLLQQTSKADKINQANKILK